MMVFPAIWTQDTRRDLYGQGEINYGTGDETHVPFQPRVTLSAYVIPQVDGLMVGGGTPS